MTLQQCVEDAVTYRILGQDFPSDPLKIASGNKLGKFYKAFLDGQGESMAHALLTEDISRRQLYVYHKYFGAGSSDPVSVPARLHAELLDRVKKVVAPDAPDEEQSLLPLLERAQTFNARRLKSAYKDAFQKSKEFKRYVRQLREMEAARI
jgi:hypothetical protein